MPLPDFDGSGPRGYGPITGSGRGFCVLKMPDTANEPITGFAGWSGRPVARLQNRSETELACLRANFQRLQVILDRLQRDINILETNRMRTHGWIGRDKQDKLHGRI
jgi:hypothetical protein